MAHGEDDIVLPRRFHQLFGEGKIGFKTGEGFQTWTPGQIKASNEGLNDYLVDMLYGKKK